ncbi:hypothetical protein ACIRNI_21590 [Streptomyces sp. NPDC093546]
MALEWSPRERGCSGDQDDDVGLERVVSARAGVFRADVTNG